MKPIGIMQGRLSPPANGRIQSFPVASWRDEFALAREAGLDCIEWIYETGTNLLNPLRTDEGILEIRAAADSSNVGVRSICADYFMIETLVDGEGAIRTDTVEHLKWLITQASKLGARYIVLPFVDSSSLRSDQQISGLLSALLSVIPFLDEHRVELHLETDLQPAKLVAVLKSFNHLLVRANYDIGNSASLGYDPREELTLLRPWLGSVHVKDRIRGGHTVPLGTGNADFSTCFALIDDAGFGGPFILQAARETGLSELDLAKRNRQFVENQMLALARA
jgi:hexulose-6-phosphate isomerase